MAGDKRQIMTLGDPDGPVPEQHLDRSEISPALQEFAGERVAEPMRKCMDPGQLPQAGDGAPQIADQGCDLAPARPEEILGIPGWEMYQGEYGILIQQHLDRHISLGSPQDQVAIGFESGTPEGSRIPNPQAAVEQQQAQSAGPLLDERILAGIPAGDAATRGKQGVDFSIGVREGGKSLLPRRPEGAGGILLGPPAPLAEGEEGAEALQFLAGCPGSHGAGLAPGSEVIGADAADIPALPRLQPPREAFQGGAVTLDRAFSERSGPAIGEVGGDPRAEACALVDRLEEIACANQDIEALEGLLPIGGLQRPPQPPASVGPQRAIAERIVWPPVAVRTSLEVPPVHMRSPQFAHQGIVLRKAK